MMGKRQGVPIMEAAMLCVMAGCYMTSAAAAAKPEVVWTVHNLTAPKAWSPKPTKNAVHAKGKPDVSRNATLQREQMHKPLVAMPRTPTPAKADAARTEACNSAFPQACYPQVTLPTAWTASVDPTAPLPEYPRPLLVRLGAWINLNGIWQLEEHLYNDMTSPPFGKTLSTNIVVPFGVEAPLSGVAIQLGAHNPQYMRFFYRRLFTLPASWTANGLRVIINFGAVDWESEVYINGQSMGVHYGGYDKFSYDITNALVAPGGQNELMVRVYDPTDLNTVEIPIGKQRLYPPGASVLYTATSGIWQTVWLEKVPPAYITKVNSIPDLDHSAVNITVNCSAAATGVVVNVAVIFNGVTVATGMGVPNTMFTIKIPAPLHLWTPNTPNLYNINATLMSSSSCGATAGDTVTSYFGMRKISMGRAGPGNLLRPMLNNQFIFFLGLLDQGYWPDGVYTAPTDAALKFDIASAKSFGFNTLRKHAKVEPDRWYYWADTLGMLVWQDFVQMFSPPATNATTEAQFEHEAIRNMQEHISNPSVVQYQCWNEGWGEPGAADVQRFTKAVQAMDPSRLVDDATGGTDYQVGNVLDIHYYPGPGSPQYSAYNQYSALGEYGGLGLIISAHMLRPQDSFYYELESSPAQLLVRLDGLSPGRGAQTRWQGIQSGLVQYMMGTQWALSAAIFTELTDVEAEVNGIMTYDRMVLKCGNLTGLQVTNAAVLAVSTSYTFNGSQPIPNGIYTIQSVGTAAEKNAQCGTYLATNPCNAGGTDGGNTLQELTSTVPANTQSLITWQVTSIGGNIYNIQGVARKACNQNSFLSCVVCGATPNANLVDTFTVDDGSGRQQWELVQTSKPNAYNVLAVGRSGCNQYLSTTVCAGGPFADLYYQDDGSGRQQWIFNRVG